MGELPSEEKVNATPRAANRIRLTSEECFENAPWPTVMNQIR